MKLNRKGVAVGIAAFALTGVLVGGTGVAVAAPGPTPPSSTMSVDPPYGHEGARMGMADNGMADRGMGDRAEMAFGENSAVAAAAEYLGLSLTDLRADLQSGQSLADVAAAQGKSVTGLEDAMVAAMTIHLDANTTLNAEEKAAALAAMQSHIEEMVTETHSPGSHTGPMGTELGTGPGTGLGTGLGTGPGRMMGR